MGFTPLTSPQDAAAALVPTLQANTRTQFLSRGVAYSNSDWLTQFNEACNQCMNQVPILSAHIYNTSPDEAIATIETLHNM